MDLKQLNNHTKFAEKKPTKKLGDLKIREPHPIVSARIVKTKFGEAILLELTDSVVFLPSRVTDAYRSQTQYLVNEKYSLIFEGAIDVGKPQPAQIFSLEETKITGRTT